MEKLTVTTLDGKKHEMRKLTGRDWRILGEFVDAAPKFTDADLMEKHASFIAGFFEGVGAQEILDLPLEEIVPLSVGIRNYIYGQLGAKLEKIEKNLVEDKAQ